MLFNSACFFSGSNGKLAGTLRRVCEFGGKDRGWVARRRSSGAWR